MKKPNLANAPPEVRKYIEYLESSLNTDPLTNVFRKEYFLSELGKIISSAFRDGRDVSAGMVDIDSFKKVNDTYGHNIGDSVLSSTAWNGRTTIRYGDVIGRYGGEEFSVGLPNTTEKEAWEVLERWRIKQDKTPLLASTYRLSVKISGGVSDLKGAPEIHFLRGERGEDAIKSLYDHGKSKKTEEFVKRFLKKLDIRLDVNEALNALIKLSGSADVFLEQNKMTGNILDYINNPEIRWTFGAYMLVGKADEALYAAKKNGKNRIITHSEII